MHGGSGRSYAGEDYYEGTDYYPFHGIPLCRRRGSLDEFARLGISENYLAWHSLDTTERKI